MLKVPGSGPKGSRIVIIGEAPGEEEEVHGLPFIGSSGRELNSWLREAGIKRDDCYVTNVCKFRPPQNDMAKWCHTKKTIGKKDGFIPFQGRWNHPFITHGIEELKTEIDWQPDIIIGLGNLALWAMTGEWGIGNWRGSEMTALNGSRFVPTLHPSSILRSWASRPYVIQDLKQRVVKRLKSGFVTPEWDFKIFPTFDEVMTFLENLRGDAAFDIETSQGHLVCLGIATSARSALCIPFKGPDGVSWNHDERKQIIAKLNELYFSGTIRVVGQNWNGYDAQYIEEDFGLRFLAEFDTLIAQSVLFPGAERGLGFLSSMYCDWHNYWKDDGKEWKTGIKDFAKEFRYNCRDVCATWEIAQGQEKMLIQAGLNKQFKERMEYSHYVFDMGRFGVNRDVTRTEKMDAEISEAIQERQLLVAEKAGKPVNFSSPKQVGELFYKQLGCKSTLKKGKVSVDDESLSAIAEKYPDHVALVGAILESRSLNSVRSNFIRAKSDPDGRFRSGWMATGTETFRLTSSGNAFHRGGPLQNLTDGQHTHSGRKLPNLRSTIIPDYGCTIFNCDLERADLQVVVWEADDLDLKQKMREHVDLHTENAKDIFGLKTVTPNHRQSGKTFVHLTNYGGQARTCAAKVGITVHEAELGQRRWFAAHPGILEWHRRTSAYLLGTRIITNKFGYRRIFFDRVDGLLPKALAWLPQSTVSILISLMQMEVSKQLGDKAPIIMQCHDSIVGQYLTANEAEVLAAIKQASRIAIPYDDPLYIGLELKTSTSSWGEVEGRDW